MDRRLQAIRMTHRKLDQAVDAYARAVVRGDEAEIAQAECAHARASRDFDKVTELIREGGLTNDEEPRKKTQFEVRIRNPQREAHDRLRESWERFQSKEENMRRLMRDALGEALDERARRRGRR